MNKEDCTIGQQVKIVPCSEMWKRFEGLIGTIKELPMGFVVVEIEVPILVGEIEPVEGEKVT